MSTSISRRAFVAGSLGVGAGAIAALGAPAQKPYKIDVHHHFLAPRQLAKVAKLPGANYPKWSPELSLAQMDANGVATAMASIVQPGVWFGNVEESRGLTRACNEYGAQLVKDHPGRFGLFATLAMPDTDGCLREIEYVFDVLKADGIGLLTEYDGKYLGDLSFAPVWAELNRRRAVVYTHPTPPACCASLIPGVTVGTIEYATDTSRTIASLLFSGTAAKFPDIRFIFSHGGGTVPFLLSRFEVLAKGRQDMPNGALPELRKFYYEVAQANHAGALYALMKMAPLQNVLFGSDYPFRDISEVVEGVAKYDFSKAQRQAIERENVMRMMPGLKT